MVNPIKKLRMFSALLIILSIPPTNAASEYNQDKETLQQLALSRAIKQQQTKQIVESNLTLTAKEAKAFWPVYENYRAEMKKVNDELLALITEYAKAYKSDNVGDKLGVSLLDKSFDVEISRIAVKRKYVTQFKSALPDKKIARFFHIDNKLEVLIKYGISREVPLIPIQ